MRTQKGFTLIELMVTIAILAILAAIAYPSYIDYIRKGRLEDDALRFWTIKN
nr:prepilin-type N-terminal cleavage/methylation domain-containing protein [Alysiella crassa]